MANDHAYFSRKSIIFAIGLTVLVMVAYATSSGLLRDWFGSSGRPITSGIVLTVGGEAVTREEFELAVDVMPGASLEIAQGGNAVMLDRIVRLKSFAHEARRRGLHNTPRMRAHLRFQEEQALANAQIASVKSAASVVPEGSIRAYYDEHRSDYDGIAAGHIVVRFAGSLVPHHGPGPELSVDQASARAEQLYDRLIAGADFGQVAMRESDDLSTRSRGGELGLVFKGRMAAEVEQAAFLLKDQGISKPIYTNYGYEIIQCRHHLTRPFDEVRSEIVGILEAKRVEVLVAGLLKKTSVVLDETYFRKSNAISTSCERCGTSAESSSSRR